MLLCGFENFDGIFVRIDILERLFLIIYSSSKKISEKNNEIEMTSEMLNLLGCSKDIFKRLLKKMNYKVFEKNNNVFFKYMPVKKIFKTKQIKNTADSPFGQLINLNIK